MRASPEIRPHLIAARMQQWLEIARYPIMNRRVPTWKARRNYRALVRKYPRIAAACGFTEALSYPSPLHGLQLQELPALPQDGSLPAREDTLQERAESPTVANSPVPRQVTENRPVPPPAAGAPRHFWALEDEVL
jgi:hypothetical protein